MLQHFVVFRARCAAAVRTCALMSNHFDHIFIAFVSEVTFHASRHSVYLFFTLFIWLVTRCYLCNTNSADFLLQPVSVGEMCYFIRSVVKKLVNCRQSCVVKLVQSHWRSTVPLSCSYLYLTIRQLSLASGFSTKLRMRLQQVRITLYLLFQVWTVMESTPFS